MRISHTYKYDLLFNRPINEEAERTIGLPRTLNMYEDYPFWHALFTSCGLKVQLSDPSTLHLYETGLHDVMSDNICFPAKLVHGHILNLIQSGSIGSSCPTSSMNSRMISGKSTAITAQLSRVLRRHQSNVKNPFFPTLRPSTSKTKNCSKSNSENTSPILALTVSRPIRPLLAPSRPKMSTAERSRKRTRRFSKKPPTRKTHHSPCRPAFTMPIPWSNINSATPLPPWASTSSMKTWYEATNPSISTTRTSHQAVGLYQPHPKIR